MTERIVVTGSTPGRITPITTITNTPTRQVRRSIAAVMIRSRTSPSTNTGTSNASATPIRTKLTKR